MENFREEMQTLFDCGLCPNCGSEQVKVQVVRKPVRKKVCRSCGLVFRTLSICLHDPADQEHLQTLEDEFHSNIVEAIGNSEVRQKAREEFHNVCKQLTAVHSRWKDSLEAMKQEYNTSFPRFDLLDFDNPDDSALASKVKASVTNYLW